MGRIIQVNKNSIIFKKEERFTRQFSQIPINSSCFMRFQKISKIFRIFNTNFMAKKIQAIPNRNAMLTNFIRMNFVTETLFSNCASMVCNSRHARTKRVRSTKMNEMFVFLVTFTVKIYNVLNIWVTFCFKIVFVTRTQKNFNMHVL